MTRMKIHFVVTENNLILREKSKILSRAVWTKHKILPLRGMPDLIYMSNILRKYPAGSLFSLFRKIYAISIVNNVFFKVAQRRY